MDFCNTLNLAIALGIVWGIAAAAWWGMHVAPMGYVGRAHIAEQKVVELEMELTKSRIDHDLLSDDYTQLVRQLERSVYYG